MLKSTQELFATKKISKELLMKNKQIKTVRMEKTVLSMFDHPNIIKLFCSYQDKDHLYFVLEFAPGGELFNKIQTYGKLLPNSIQFYAAEIVLGLEHLHSKKVIHRDMKPENIIFDKEMHLKITDFGTAKIKDYQGSGVDLVVTPNSRETFCGTAQYVSPELLNGEPCTSGSDLWALGCIIYQMSTTRAPFVGASDYLIFQKIKDKDFTFPTNMNRTTKDLIKKLLVIEPQKRLGAKGYQELKDHGFFKGIDWDLIHNQTPPPMVHPERKKKIDEQLKLEKMKEDQRESMQRRKAALDKIGTFKDLIKKGSDFNNFAEFLNRKEEIIYAGELFKGRGLARKKRTVLFTTRPRVIYVDLPKGEIKGTIEFDGLEAELINEKRFDIKIPGRTYAFEDINLTADVWVDQIEKISNVFKQLDRIGALN